MTAIFLTLLALILRIPYLNQSFWLDEAISAVTASKPFPYQITGISGDFQPPFYYLILHLLLKFNIHSEWFLRIPGVVFGVMTVYLVYEISAELFSKRTAIIAGLLVATSQFHIYYSQELRMYSLLALLSVLSLRSFLKKNRIQNTLWGILGIYTSYMYFFIIFTQVALLLFFEKSKKNRIKGLIFHSLIVISFLLWMPMMLEQFRTSRQILSDLPLWGSLSNLALWKILPLTFVKFTLGRIMIANRLLYILIAVFLSFTYINIFRKAILFTDKKIKKVMLWVLIPLTSIIFISLFIPIANYWRLIFLLPPFYILTGYFVEKDKYRIIYLFIIIVVNICSILYYWTDREIQREDWRGAVAFAEETEAGIIFTSEEAHAPYLWYKKQDKKICGIVSYDQCIADGKFYYFPYLKDLLDPRSTIENSIKRKGILQETVKNFPGVGFVYYYEDSN